jgi:hypothetical protein
MAPMQPVVGLLLLILGVAPASAHHGWSSYDSTRELTLTGTITESGYEHPHGHVRLDVPGKIWLVILAPPTRMEHRGLPASKLRAGTKATVVGYPHRSTADEMRAERITIDGATVELR